MTPRERCIRFTLSEEGVRWAADGHVIATGISDRRTTDDPGGLTNWGIALNRHPKMTAAQLLALTYEEALAIWTEEYWVPVHGDDLPEWLALMLFDTAAPHGVGGAVTMLQTVLGYSAGGRDGDFGPRTMAAVRGFIASQNSADMITEYMAERLVFDAGLANWKANARGWSRRSIRVVLAAERLVIGSPTA